MTTLGPEDVKEYQGRIRALVRCVISADVLAGLVAEYIAQEDVVAQWLKEVGPVTVLINHYMPLLIMFARDGRVWTIDVPGGPPGAISVNARPLTIRTEPVSHTVSADCVISVSLDGYQASVQCVRSCVGDSHAAFNLKADRDWGGATRQMRCTHIPCGASVIMVYRDDRFQFDFFADTRDGRVEVKTVVRLCGVRIREDKRFVEAYMFHSEPAEASSYVLPPDFIRAISLLPGWDGRWSTKLLGHSPDEFNGCIIRAYASGVLRLLDPRGVASRLHPYLEAMTRPLMPFMRERRLIVTIRTDTVMMFNLCEGTLEQLAEPEAHGKRKGMD